MIVQTVISALLLLTSIHGMHIPNEKGLTLTYSSLKYMRKRSMGSLSSFPRVPIRQLSPSQSPSLPVAWTQMGEPHTSKSESKALSWCWPLQRPSHSSAPQSPSPVRFLDHGVAISPLTSVFYFDSCLETFVADASVFRISGAVRGGSLFETCTFSANSPGTCVEELPNGPTSIETETFSGTAIPFYTLAAAATGGSVSSTGNVPVSTATRTNPIPTPTTSASQNGAASSNACSRPIAVFLALGILLRMV